MCDVSNIHHLNVNVEAEAKEIGDMIFQFSPLLSFVSVYRQSKFWVEIFTVTVEVRMMILFEVSIECFSNTCFSVWKLQLIISSRY